MEGLSYDRYTSAGWVEGDVSGALQTIYGQGSRAEHSGLYSSIASGADPFSLATTAGGLAASEGDLGSVASLQPALGGKGLYAELLKQARSVMQTQTTMHQSQMRTNIGELTGAGYKTLNRELGGQAGSLVDWRNAVRQMRDSAPAEHKGDFDNILLQIEAQLAAIPKQQAGIEYGQRGQAIGAAGLTASTAFNRTLYGGGGADALDRGYAGQATQIRRRAALLREKAGRHDIYNESERAQFAAEADQAEQEASVQIPRQASFTRYGLDQAQLGIQSAHAGAAASHAQLFGGTAETAGAVRMQSDVVAENIRQVVDLLKRGNLTAEEQRRYQAQLVDLNTKQAVLAEEEVRGKARGEYSVAQGNLGLASTEQQTAFMRGVGGLQGQALTFGLLDKGHTATGKAQALVDLLRKRGVAEDNPELMQAKQSLASSQQAEVGTELSLAHSPMPIAQSRELSSARYQADVLSTMPGVTATSGARTANKRRYWKGQV